MASTLLEIVAQTDASTSGAMAVPHPADIARAGLRLSMGHINTVMTEAARAPAITLPLLKSKAQAVCTIRSLSRAAWVAVRLNCGALGSVRIVGRKFLFWITFLCVHFPVPLKLVLHGLRCVARRCG